MVSIIIIIAGIIGGIIAAISGFGIGSVLTPLFALEMETKIAIAAVAIPHFLGTGFRLWTLRKNINYRILWTFGITAAAFGLLGALLHSYVNSKVLTIIFGAILSFAGIMGITGWAQKLEFKGPAAWIAGALSGGLGGLVGSQGGIRSAAMLGIKVPKIQFIATATAIAIFVDIARIPVYIGTGSEKLWQGRYLILTAAAAVIIGTLAGQKLLKLIPENAFKRVVACIILILGFWMILKSFR